MELSLTSRRLLAGVGTVGGVAGLGVVTAGPQDTRTVSRFERDALVLKNQNVLRDDYEPENLEERDEELDEYAAALRPVVRGWQPNNVFLYGVTGVGKTATHVLLNDLRESTDDYDDIDLELVELNCTGLSSTYQVVVNLVNEFRSTSHPLTTIESPNSPISESGHQQKRVFRELYEDIEAIDGTVLIVLDEIDNIGTDDDILYELPRARTNYDLDAKIGIIGISNDFKFRDNLSPKVEDTLCEEEVLFPPYNPNELKNILDKRATEAFYDGVLNDDVIPLAAAISA